VGGSINFGFTAKASGEVTWPTFFAFNTKTTEVAAELLKVEYLLRSDWGSGYSAALKITNLFQTKIEDWTIDFDFARSIGNLSSGKILAHNGTHYGSSSVFRTVCKATQSSRRRVSLLE